MNIPRRKKIYVFIASLLLVTLACGANNDSSDTIEAEVPQLNTNDEQSVAENIEPIQETEVVQEGNIPDLEILSSHSYEDNGWFHIVGEVRNNSDFPMEFVKIVATLYDDNNDVMGADFTYSYLDIIPPGGKSPFSTNTDTYSGVTNYKIQAQGSISELGRQGLEILSHSHYIDNGWLHVQGEVQNNGTSDADFVKIIITLYDINGIVVGTDFTYSTLDPVPVNGTSPFESGTDHWPEFDHYEIQIQ